VLVGTVVLVVPVVDEHAAVYIAASGAAAVARFNEVLQLVEPAVLALDAGDQVPGWIADGHGAAEGRLPTHAGFELDRPQPTSGAGGDSPLATLDAVASNST
jgi:hypothetical protein